MDLTITLDAYESGPLYKQIYDEIRKAILYGRLKPGEKLPSSRELADSLKVSRITVTQSYDQLLAEGYIKTVKGAGSFVCDEIPDFQFHTPREEPGENRLGRRYDFSDSGEQLSALTLPSLNFPPEAIWFKVGALNLEAFPWTIWRRLVTRHCQAALAGYAEQNRGPEILRKAIAEHVARARAVNCKPEQIIILNGTIHALDLLSRLFLSPGDGVAFEEPGWPAARRTFAMAGAKIIPVEVDDEGLVVEKLPDDRSCKLLFLTPSHQFPTGAVLSLKRRLEVLAWAQRNNVVIFEDDYESELRYAGRPVPSLQGLDRGGSVIYAGTFSKVIFPNLRLSYVVLPEALVPGFEHAKSTSIWDSGVLEQWALADFFAEGHYERHIRKMRQVYGSLRKTLVIALEKYLSDAVTVVGDSAGMHLMLRLRSRYTDDELVARAQEHGVIIGQGSRYYQGEAKGGEFPLGYGSLSHAQIEEGIRRLSLAIK